MKDIKEYTGLYAITKNGKVWSYKNNKFLKEGNNGGYLFVILCKDGKKKKHLIHRLVAEAYIPNPDNLPQINHKDEDKTNNYVENLEWCNAKYNSNYGKRNNKISEANKGEKSYWYGKKRSEKTKRQMSEAYSKSVRCIETNIIYSSMTIAEKETKIHQSNISKCCKGKRKTAGGYHWEYV